ncbi:uncharacterized protein LOC114323164 isoform X3 [Camellia sinensis]|uniref:uncharacterized protein LOC114323164 isoform X3 n=1 Tax=Camellia sinensis TaxID=4442 RepID=UPI0010363F35|nr:uncharacterized protein LOC114323164 isoform X3 [Camellia sinensis]
MINFMFWQDDQFTTMTKHLSSLFSRFLIQRKELPRPPWTDPAQFKLGGDYIYHHFVWGRKIVFCTRAGFYIFDTDMNKWDFTDEKLSPFPIISCASAEYYGFLIAMPWDHQQLVVYRLDSDSDADAIAKPYPYRVLDELWPVFNPPFAGREFQGFLTHLGDGDGDGGCGMCLLYAGFDYYSRWCARVANFQVSISCNDAGDWFLYAYLETLQHYDFEKFDNPARWIDSAFVMYVRCDYLNKHDVEADKSLMDACLSGSDRGDYLNNHDVEANASFMDAYLARSDEYYYLNKHEVVADASFRDAYLSRSDDNFGLVVRYISLSRLGQNYPDESYSYIECFWPVKCWRVNLNQLNVEVDGSFMCAHLSGLYRCFHLS